MSEKQELMESLKKAKQEIQDLRDQIKCMHATRITNINYFSDDYNRKKALFDGLEMSCK